MERNILEEALKYYELGFWPIPIRFKSKKPLVEWKRYQEQRPTKDELGAWFTEYSDANIGFITGRRQNLIAVDLDKKDGEIGSPEGLPETVKVETGSGGQHLYYRYPQNFDEDIGNKAKIRPLTDIRGTGGFIVAPPSVHENGKLYKWITSPEKTEVAEFPVGLLKGEEKDNVGAIRDGVPEGRRNESATRMAGHYIARYSSKKAWRALKKWNSKNRPPLTEGELRRVFDSISKKEEEKQNKKDNSRQIDQLNEIIGSDKVAEIFIDELEEAYVQVQIDGHYENLRCDSQRFRNWLTLNYFRKTNEIPAPENIKKVVSLIQAKAAFGDKKYNLFLRIARKENVLYYDLADARWRAVRIDEKGWDVVDRPPILFRRVSIQNEQIIPVKGGNVRDLLEFVNIKDEKQALLYLVGTIANFIPDIGRPIQMYRGSQGSAKSTTSKLNKSLCDPAKVELITLNNDIKELTQQLNQHYLLPFDNITRLSTSTSDALCRAATGGGFTKRKLYTDDENIIFIFKRALILNGINTVGHKPDLLDRSLLFNFERIDETERKSEEFLMAEFEKKKPAILGAIFDVLSQALRILPTIRLTQLPRLADFGRWGCAITEALGEKKEFFIEAYQDNLGIQNELMIEEDPLASTMLAFMSHEIKDWRGSSTELYKKLKEVAEQEEIDLSCFPKNPSALSRRINEIKVNLRAEGIEIKKTGQREWQIRRKRR